MRLKAIVTGANGMLGDSLCPLLENKGYNITATDIAVNANIFKLDVRDLQSCVQALNGVDTVIHCAFNMKDKFRNSFVQKQIPSTELAIR